MSNNNVIVGCDSLRALKKQYPKNIVIYISKNKLYLEKDNGETESWNTKSHENMDNIFLHHDFFVKTILSIKEHLPEKFSLKFIDNNKFRAIYIYFAHILAVKYSILVTKKIESVDLVAYSFMNNADSITFGNSNLEKVFRDKYIGFYRNDEQQNNALIKKIDNHKDITSKKKRLLIVAYFSGQCRSVGVQRVNYWYENIESLSKNEWDVELVTAIQPDKKDPKVHYVPDLNVATLVEGEDYKRPAWMYRYFLMEKEHRKFINTFGFYWLLAIERYFSKIKVESYDAVIISGNPFSYFSFASYAQLNWFSKVILDYRDPFANNPRFKYSEQAREFAKRYEQGINYHADHIITVNNKCLDYVEGGEGIPKSVIRNGFDDNVSEKIAPGFLKNKRKQKFNFVHAGTIYPQCTPELLVNMISSFDFTFHHIGTTKFEVNNLNTNIENYGRKDYKETLSLLACGHCGVVFIPEVGFDTPTKLYDYLGVGIDILIITAIDLSGSEILSLLKDHERVFFVDNEEDSIRSFLENYEPGTNLNKNINDKFSRKNSTLELIALLDKLN